VYSTWSVEAHVGNNVVEATAHVNLHGLPLIRLEIKRVETIVRLEEDDAGAVRKGSARTTVVDLHAVDADSHMPTVDPNGAVRRATVAAGRGSGDDHIVGDDVGSRWRWRLLRL
jgi:hypothetical protein